MNLKTIKKQKLLLICLIVIMTFSFLGKMEASAEDTSNLSKLPEIGVAIYSYNDNYMSYIRKAIEMEASGKATVLMNDSQNSQAKQVEQVDTMISNGVKVLVINLVDPKGAQEIIDKAKTANIPVIFFNNEPEATVLGTYDKCWYVGVDLKEAGILQGKMIAELWKNNKDKWDKNNDGILSYVLLKGVPGQPAAEARTTYSIKAINDAGIKTERLSMDTAMWDSTKATQKMDAWISKFGSSIEFVISNNDGMALGALDSLEKAGYSSGDKLIPVIGINGIPAATAKIKEGKMAGTILDDAKNQGKAAIDLAVNIANGKDPVSGTPWTLDDNKAVRVPYIQITNDYYSEGFDPTVMQTLTINKESSLNLKKYFTLDTDFLENLTWTSNNTSLAVVSNGVMTGLENGTVTITASNTKGVLYGVFTIAIVPNDTISRKLGAVRLGGTDRYETSIKISRAGWEAGSQYAVIATGNNYPDALSAAPLAKKYNAPILLTNTNTLPQEIADELTRLKVNHVFITGGTGAVSQTVENQINSMGISAERFGGQNRFETSVKIAKKLGIASGEIFVTNGYGFADALSASSLAAKMNMPILITDGDALPDVVKRFINENNFSKTYVLGDKDLISDNVVSVLPGVERIVGSTIYERNINIIKKFKNDIDFSSICIATGENFPDALSGSALAAKVSSAIVLVDNNDLQDITTEFANEKTMQVNDVYIFGSQGVVSDSIVKKLFNK